MHYGSLFAAFDAAPNVVFGVLSLLYVLASLYVYSSLIHQISAQRPDGVGTNALARTFGMPEAILAALLILFFRSASACQFRSHRSNSARAIF